MTKNKRKSLDIKKNCFYEGNCFLWEIVRQVGNGIITSAIGNFLCYLTIFSSNEFILIVCLNPGNMLSITMFIDGFMHRLKSNLEIHQQSYFRLGFRSQKFTHSQCNRNYTYTSLLPLNCKNRMT